MQSGIYKITNVADGKSYIGSAVDFGRRWVNHRYDLRKDRHHSPKLQNAFWKHGEGSFRFERLIVCAKEHLLFFEQRALDAFRPEYNLMVSAESRLGLSHSVETKERMSESKQGFRMSPEHRVAFMAGARSPETRAKLSAIRKGRKLPPFSEEWRAKISATVSAQWAAKRGDTEQGKSNKRCPACSDFKEMAAFSYCRKCHAAYARARRQKYRALGTPLRK